MGLIVYSSSNPFLHHHLHQCFYCKKHKYEDNRLCKKQGDHAFPCYVHIQHYREAFGMLDALVDVVISQQERDRFVEEWQEAPDKNPTDFRG